MIAASRSASAGGVPGGGIDRLVNLALRAVLNVALLAAFWWNGLTTEDIVRAFAFTSVVVDGVIWLPLMEFAVWRPMRAGAVRE